MLEIVDSLIAEDRRPTLLDHGLGQLFNSSARYDNPCHGTKPGTTDSWNYSIWHYCASSLCSVIVPSSEEIVDCFKGVEEIANRDCIEDVVRHLYRAKCRLLIGHAEHSRSKRRPTLVKNISCDAIH